MVRLISMLFLVSFSIFHVFGANAAVLLPSPDLGGGFKPSNAALIGDLECAALDGKSDLSLRRTPFGLRLAIHSQELSMYVQIAYGVELGRLEAVREADGTSIIDLTPNGFRAMAYAPTANRPDVLWAVDFAHANVGAQSAQPPQSTVRLSDPQGHLTQLAVDCASQSTP